ncbi:MAG TPA: GyrI-like domain-containing protein [Anaerolineales bacterium]|nr:GyrI-like domain-containing protein [Anaerolineales bacterium]
MTTQALQCTIVDREAQPALAFRTRTRVTELPALMGRALGTVAEFLAVRGVTLAGPPFAAYFNDDMNDLEVAIGFPVARFVEGQGEVQPIEIPAGRHATCVHVGPYTGLGGAYEALTRWIKDRGETALGVVYEFYLDDPDDTPPEALQTQIVFPLLG